MNLFARYLNWVFGTAGIQYCFFHAGRKLKVQQFIKVAVSRNGVAGKVFVTNDDEIGIQLAGRMDRAIDHLPKESCLPDNIIRFNGLHLVTIKFQMIAHQ